jgi:hypothetical protein
MYTDVFYLKTHYDEINFEIARFKTFYFLMNSSVLLTFEVFKIPDDPRIERLRERPAYYNAEGTLPPFNKPVYELTKPQ